MTQYNNLYLMIDFNDFLKIEIDSNRVEQFQNYYQLILDGDLNENEAVLDVYVLNFYPKDNKVVIGNNFRPDEEGVTMKIDEFIRKIVSSVYNR
jgi:hypothetical protein